jgi:hypothetical protein
MLVKDSIAKAAKNPQLKQRKILFIIKDQNHSLKSTHMGAIKYNDYIMKLFRNLCHKFSVLVIALFMPS